jgi:AraC family transcriptional regulator
MPTRLGRYAASFRQGWHRDCHSRITFVLRGAFSEDGPRGSLDFAPGDVLLKSSDVVHRDAFGPEGAILLALEVTESDTNPIKLGAGRWRRRRDTESLRLALSFFDAIVARDAKAAQLVASDIVDSDGDQDRKTAPPAWLLRLKDELETSSLAEVDAGSRAREAGVHPAHLSRLFRRATGVSLTEYAHTHSVRRALQLMGRSRTPLSDVAAAAGFYDQSHMNRVFRRVCGRTPAAHRALIEGLAASG